MKKNLHYFIFVAAAALLTLVSSCTENIEPTRVEQGDTFFFSVKANKSEALTKSLTAVHGYAATHNIISKWDENEEVGVYNSSDEKVGTLVVKTISNEGKTATLEGTISNTVSKDDVLTLKVQSPDNYGSQDGTLAYIAAHCDYQTATVTIGSVDAEGAKAYATSNSVSFQSQQAIIAFNLTQGYQTTFNPTDLSIRYGNNIIGYNTIEIHNIDYDAVHTSNSASGFEWYWVFVVALPGFEGDLTLTGKDQTRAGDWHYTADVNIKNGNAYYPTVYMYRDLYAALTFEAMEAGAKVKFKPGNNVDITKFEYSITGDIYNDEWSEFVAFTGEEGNNVITLPQAGRKVRFRGKASSCASSAGESNSSTFSCDKPCYVYGNVMSMVGGNNYQYASDIVDEEYVSISSSIPGDNAFANLFNGNTNIYNHPFKPLVLPATGLTTLCYYQMFQGCTHLTIAPELPASTLAERCYLRMFNGCSGLITPPSTIGAAANATLAYKCCEEMFHGCESLTVAPALPAITLAYDCYANMFEGCTSLTAAPVLAAESLAGYCYYAMFSGCSKLAAAPALPATALASACYRDMFNGCTSLTTVPSLPATTLKEYCYESMFSGCTGLTTASIQISSAEGTLDEGCCYEMFNGCINLTTAPSLPAMTIPVWAYRGMFQGCTSLKVAPSLPATTLIEDDSYAGAAGSNYADMFNGCISLTSAPSVLPVENLTRKCYEKMFYGCTSLTTAPAQISASTGSLADKCCSYMFHNCESLTTAPALPATSLAPNCYEYMFQGCSSLGAAPALPATALRQGCYQYMFKLCSSLAASPVLGAPTLESECYKYMFSYCGNLSSLTCLATAKSQYASSCTIGWLDNVSSTGTFYKSSSVEYGLNGFWPANGSVPNNWEIKNYQE